MRKYIYVIIASTVFLYSCSEKKQEVIETSKAEQITKTPLDSLKMEVERTQGGSFATDVKLEGDKAVIQTLYNFKDYKKAHPNSNLDAATYYDYFTTEKSFKKSINRMPVHLLRKLPFVNSVSYQIFAKHEQYKIDLNRDQFIKYFGGSPESFENDYVKKIIDPIVYDEKGREKFFKTFGSGYANLN